MSDATAHLCLLDALACAFRALHQPACAKVLGPVVPGATMTFGARVPGTSLQLDPVQAAFNLGTMIGWLGQREAALARSDGHLSDTLGALLSVADYVARRSLAEGREPLTVSDVLSALRAADAIPDDGQSASSRPAVATVTDGSRAIEVACATSVVALLGGSPAQLSLARELAMRDARAAALDVASRPPWWLGEANARGVRLALLAMAEVPAGSAVPPVLEPPAPIRPLPVVDPATATRVRDGFFAAVTAHFPPSQAGKIKALLADQPRLAALPINELVSLTVRN